MRSTCFAFALAAVALAGCELDDPDLDSTALEASCYPLCGTNSAVVDGVEFHELAANGITRNDQGLKLLSVTDHNGQAVRLNSAGDVLYGYPVVGKRKRYPLLAGTVIRVNMLAGGTSTNYDLTIAAVGSKPYWVDDTTGSVTTYHIQWQHVVNPLTPQELCPATAGLTDSDLDPNHFVAFTGDRYDADAKTVTAGDYSWINFACAGSATSKLHLTRHTQAGSNGAHQTSQTQRQAMLKMYSADYCGDGTAFTETGTPILINDANDWIDTFENAAVDSLESVWTDAGAVCLDVPRYVELADIGDIPCAATLPPCGGLNPWQASGHVLSGNPL